MTDKYTINDAWEDGYQVGYERGVLRMMEYMLENHEPGLVDDDVYHIARWLAERAPIQKSKDEWYEFLRKVCRSVKRVGYGPLKIKEE